MRFHYGLYLLLVVVSVLAVVFAALRAWGAIGFLPLIFGALGVWVLHAGIHIKRSFESTLLCWVGILFAFLALVLASTFLLERI